MKFQKYFFIAAYFLTISLSIKAQISKGVKAEIEIQTIGTTNKVVPFWMRSNQFGSVPITGISGSVIGRVARDYAEFSQTDRKVFDWGAGFEGRANGGNKSNLTVIEAYLKGRLSIFQLKIGRTKDVMGLNGDTTLSSGNFAVSGNSLGIPKLDLSIPDYFRIPVFDGLFSFKGNIVHGWLGRTKILSSINSLNGQLLYKIDNTLPKTYFHQKSFYGRFGKDSWRLNLFGGFNHQVFWGDEKNIYQGNFKLSPLETFFYVATGKTYGASGVPTSKIGNQIGSIDLAVEYRFNQFKLKLYRQNFYDVGALSKLANITDGLNGITITNNNYNKDLGRNFNWKSLLFEVFYSKDQAGYPWSTPTKSGDEDYYNNFFYVQGWTYKGYGLGNPLITKKDDARDGQASAEFDYYINNRVIAYHFGIEGDLYNWDFKTKVSISKNYGTFGTSIYGKSTGAIRTPQTSNIFKPVGQVSLYLEGSKEVKKDLRIGFMAAIDHGRLLNNSSGVAIKVIRSFY